MKAQIKIRLVMSKTERDRPLSELGKVIKFTKDFDYFTIFKKLRREKTTEKIEGEKWVL